MGHLARAASLVAPASGSHAVGALQQFAGWLDYRACQRAGRCPVLLVNLRFQDGGWWDRIAKEPTAPQLNAPAALFAQEHAAPLLREILMEACSVSRSMPSAASFLFGMSPLATQAISRLTMHDIERIVTQNARHLRPRWENSGTFWPQLLRAATGTDNEAMVNIQLHCLSLMGS